MFLKRFFYHIYFSQHFPQHLYSHVSYDENNFPVYLQAFKHMTTVFSSVAISLVSFP